MVDAEVDADWPATAQRECGGTLASPPKGADAVGERFAAKGRMLPVVRSQEFWSART